METLLYILEQKGKAVHRTTPEETVLDAVDAMCRAKVGALLVMKGDKPIGIVSERDVLTRLVLARRNPAETKVADVMTSGVVCIPSTASPEQAMAIMTERHCRHLPVVRGGAVEGIISIGDLVRWASRHQEYEIRLLSEYLGGYPSNAPLPAHATSP